MKDFGGETPYSVMFGPDICGYSTKKVHVIVAGKDGKNHEVTPDPSPITDRKRTTSPQRPACQSMKKTPWKWLKNSMEMVEKAIQPMFNCARLPISVPFSPELELGCCFQHFLPF